MNTKEITARLNKLTYIIPDGWTKKDIEKFRKAYEDWASSERDPQPLNPSGVPSVDQSTPPDRDKLVSKLLSLRTRDNQKPIRTFKFTIESYEKGTKSKRKVTTPTLLDAFFKVKPGVYTDIFDKGYNYYKNPQDIEEIENEVNWRKSEKAFINWVEDQNGDGADIIIVEENNKVIIGDGFSDYDHDY